MLRLLRRGAQKSRREYVGRTASKDPSEEMGEPNSVPETEAEDAKRCCQGTRERERERERQWPGGTKTNGNGIL